MTRVWMIFFSIFFGIPTVRAAMMEEDILPQLERTVYCESLPGTAYFWELRGKVPISVSNEQVVSLANKNGARCQEVLDIFSPQLDDGYEFIRSDGVCIDISSFDVFGFEKPMYSGSLCYEQTPPWENIWAVRRKDV